MYKNFIAVTASIFIYSFKRIVGIANRRSGGRKYCCVTETR